MSLGDAKHNNNGGSKGESLSFRGVFNRSKRVFDCSRGVVKPKTRLLGSSYNNLYPHIIPLSIMSSVVVIGGESDQGTTRHSLNPKVGTLEFKPLFNPPRGVPGLFK